MQSLNSPLIPTITNKPASNGNVLKLKYTLPSGVIVYSHRKPTKCEKDDDHEDLKSASIDVNEKVDKNIIYIYRKEKCIEHN